MIVSASRKTDIPAFFTPWFVDKIRKSFCCVKNPFNPNQVKKVSLKVEDVDLFVFWTKNPGPFLPFLGELDKMGYKYFFLFTLNPYEKPIEPYSGEVKERIRFFREFSETIGSIKVIWRYDPIIISREMDYSFHLEKFSELADSLKGATKKAIFSFYSSYRSSDKRLNDAGIKLLDSEEEEKKRRFLLEELVEIGEENGISLSGCATKHYAGAGIKPGKCIDEEYIEKVFGIIFPAKKDVGQRKDCGCIPSQDIGTYGTCLNGCLYCYARGKQKKERNNFSNRRITSPFLLKNN